MAVIKKIPYRGGLDEVRRLLHEHPELDTFYDLGLYREAEQMGLASFSIPGRLHVEQFSREEHIRSFTDEDAVAAVGGPKVDEPREYTRQEEHDMFVEHVAGLVDYWSGPTIGREGKSHREHLQHCVEGVAHSILTTLQGSSCTLPGYYLIPMGTEEDKRWSIENSRNYHRVSEELSAGSSPYNDALADGYVGTELFDHLRNLRKRYTGEDNV